MKRLIAGLVLFAGAATAPALAQEWPTRQPIKVIVTLSPGSATDVLARIAFEQVSKQIGQAIVIENRPGAGQRIGTTAASRAEPDGYTLLVNSSTHTLFSAMFTNLQFDVKRDFVALAPLASIPTVMVTPPSRGWTSLAAFVAQAKAKPGAINYGSGGIGNSTHLAAERVRMAAGFEGAHVPFAGAPEAINEVVAGRVDFYFSPVPPALSLIREGQLKPLAVTSARRSSVLPDVPTTVEAGFPNSGYEFWVGAFAPAKTPRPIVDRLARELSAALLTPQVREKYAALGADPMPMSAQEFDDYIAKEIELNVAIVKAVGIKPE
ncbi:MAG: tripartite tricarboxylate transporter family receptor [Hyphomicrobiales bacterium]|jgi:tripartite-type tricarboxylate transporter receptor subunit TctC|nr:tripartite tricarboxylate transporter family receptor [Hyphomicrobiales bacterium]